MVKNFKKTSITAKLLFQAATKVKIQKFWVFPGKKIVYEF
jgi:hypothetical protein